MARFFALLYPGNLVSFGLQNSPNLARLIALNLNRRSLTVPPKPQATRSMTKLITGSVVTAILCSSFNGCSRGDIMEAIAISSAIAGAATAITIVAVHEATERQRQLAHEQGHFAYQQLIEQHKTRGVKESRYIAVATVREPDSKGAKSLMIFDTQTDQVVGNHVYDVKTEPKTGQVVKFEAYSAEYVGTGQY